MLHGGSKILEGSILYLDIPALNPPLIYIYASLSVFLSKLLFLSKESTFIILILTLVFISLYLSYKVLEKYYDKNNSLSLRLYIYSILVILTICISSDFGEREHLFVIFILPYLLSMVYKDKIFISKDLTIFIALFAVLGFNIKPHFFLIFLGIEFIYFIQTKNLKSIFRIDFLIIASSGFLYFLFIYVFYNEYLTISIPLAIEIYTDTFNKTYYFLLFNLNIVFTTLVILFWLILSKRKVDYSFKAFLSLLLTSLLIYIIQKKGWTYHIIPFSTFSYLFLTHTFLNCIKKSQRIYMLVFAFLTIYLIKQTINMVPRFNELENIISELPSKSKIHIISVDVARGQSLLVKKDQIWASRFAGLIILNPIWKDKTKTNLKKYMFDSIIEDMNKYKPDTVIFCGKYSKFDYYGYFSTENKVLSSLYNSNYSKKVIDGYTILSKIKDF
jgi:hypothetical protein